MSDIAVDRTCLSTVDTEYGVIGNPLLGNVYPNKATCTSTIKGRIGPLLLLVAYDMEEEITCQYDSLHIGTNTQMGQRLSRYCGKGTHMFKGTVACCMNLIFMLYVYERSARDVEMRLINMRTKSKVLK